METLEARGGDRVSIETAVHQLFRELTERSNDSPEAAPFLLMKDVFMWAVVLGVKSGKRLSLSGAKMQIFRWDQLSQDLDVPLLRALAVAETGEIEVLLREDLVLRIAEEYANAGIREMKEDLLNRSGQPLWNLVSAARTRAS